MDGLMPKRRSDKGTSRVLSDTAVAEIIKLKEQFPRINAALIYTKLITEGFIKKCEVSLSSVQRYIKKNDLRSARNPNLCQMSYTCLSTISVTEFYHQLFIQLGLEPSGRKTEMFNAIQDRVRYLIKEKRKTTLIASVILYCCW